jgi:hypothetical protein
MTDRYANGKIYKLVSNQTDEVYYGSTCHPLYKRLYFHKSDYKRWIDGKRKWKITSFNIVKYDDCQIILVREYPCDNKSQLARKERYYIEKYQCVNKNIPGRTPKQYNEDNKEKVDGYKKKHYKENKAEIDEYKKKYREENKEKMAEYKKKHYKENKERIDEYYKKYREKKYMCACGKTIRRDAKTMHERTEQHKIIIKISSISIKNATFSDLDQSAPRPSGTS